MGRGSSAPIWWSTCCSRDHDILCLDNYFTGSKINLLHLRDHPRLELIRHDVVNPIMLEVDQVYHLACPASPVHYQYNPVKTIKTNVLGTLNMLGLVFRNTLITNQDSVTRPFLRIIPPNSLAKTGMGKRRG